MGSARGLRGGAGCASMAAMGLLALAACVVRTSGEIIVCNNTEPGVIRDEFDDEPAAFGDSLPLEGLSGYLVVGVPKDGCTALAPPPTDENFYGKWIVLLARYNCNFDDKVRNAQNAGYRAAIVHNNNTDLHRMSAKNPVGITIPSVFVNNETGHYLETSYTYKNNFYIIMNRETPFDINTHLLLPFAIVVGLCLVTMVIFMIVKCIKDRRRARRHRLPNNALKKIPTCKYSKGDPYDTCAICLDDYLEGDKLRVLPCAHAYHCKCIDPWLTKNRRVCPVCKRRVFAAGERRSRREREAARRPRVSDSDSESDDSRTPLVTPEDNPPTQGGTFAPQRENPFARAARYMSRLRARDAATASAPQPSNEVVVDTEDQAEPEISREVEETERFENGEGAANHPPTEVRAGKKSSIVPFLSGVLNLRNNHFGRGSGDDTEPLMPQPQSSLPAENCSAFLESEREAPQSLTRSKRRPDSRQRSTSESTARAAAGAARDNLVVSAEHSINREDQGRGAADAATAERGEIGVAALPNTQLSQGTGRNDFII